jgi:hypothetical protein
MKLIKKLRLEIKKEIGFLDKFYEIEINFSNIREYADIWYVDIKIIITTPIKEFIIINRAAVTNCRYLYLVHEVTDKILKDFHNKIWEASDDVGG